MTFDTEGTYHTKQCKTYPGQKQLDSNIVNITLCTPLLEREGGKLERGFQNREASRKESKQDGAKETSSFRPQKGWQAIYTAIHAIG